MKVFRFIFLVLSGILYCSISYSQTILPEFENIHANDAVYSTVYDETNDLLYVGGAFTKIGPIIQYGYKAAISDGTLASSFPEVNGKVEVVIPDGSGGFYIGGSFTEVGGLTRNNLAQINSSGSVTSWDPSSSGTIHAMLLDNGIVYVGGAFATIGGTSQSTLAAINASTGVVSTTFPEGNSPVYALHIDNGILYVGGTFTVMGGEFRDRIAAIDISTENVTSWDPGASSTVYTMDSDGTNLYVGGNFTTIAGSTRNRIASFKISDGSLNAWDPNASSTVQKILIDGSTIYAGGSFTSIGGQSRNRIAALNTSGTATTWDPNSNSTVYSLTLNGGSLYATGSFSSIGGQSVSGIAKLDPSTGNADTWSIPILGTVESISFVGTDFYFGGSFTIYNGDDRVGLACIDMSTGIVTSWDPGLNGNVQDMVLTGTSLIVGGTFTDVGGQTRNRIAEINTSTGAATTWNPNASSTVNTLKIDGSSIYAGGFFTSIGGQSRNYIAELNLSDGLATSWNPNANGIVYAIDTLNGDVFFGGAFTSVGGTTRNRMAAVDASTGALESFDANANNTVYDIVTSTDGVVYTGGQFTSIGGQSRNRIAALDPTTGTADALWNPSASSTVIGLYLSSGGTLYTGGSFTSIGGKIRRRVAAIYASTGEVSDWDLNASSTVQAFTDYAGNIILGGNFGGVLDQTQSRIVGVTRSNEAPLDIEIDDNTIQENLSSGTLVGTLSSIDDAGDTHTYSLVAGEGDDDNASFTISGDQLLSNAVFDFESKNSYTIRVSSNDGVAGSIEKVFSISVSNEIEGGNDIISFSIPEELSSTIDDVNHTITIDVAFDTDRSSLTPTFEISSGATSSPLTNIAQDFTNPVAYTITSESGVPQVWTVTVIPEPYPGGTYTVGLTGADFETIKDAANALSVSGFTGDITLELLADQTTFNNLVADFDVPGGVNTHTLTIQPASGVTNIRVEESIRIDDFTNFIFDGQNEVTFEEVGYAFVLLAGAQNIEIRNINIDGRNGILSATQSGISDVIIENCTFTSVNPSTQLYGIRTSSSTENLIIRNNSLTFNASIDGSLVYGMSVDGINAEIYNNVINIFPTNATTIRGMYVPSPNNFNVHHNTIRIAGSAGGTESIIGVDIVSFSNSSIAFQNNLISVERNPGTSGSMTGMTFADLSTDFITHNNVFVSSYPGTTGITREILNYSSTGYDESTIAGLDIEGFTTTSVTFLDAANSDLSLSGSSLSNKDFRGVPIVEITEDINGTSRSTTSPSKGAYEHPNNIAEILSFDVAGQSGDEVISTIFFNTVELDVVAGTDISNLTPTIAVSPGATIDPPSGVAQDFTNTVIYTVTAEDGSTVDFDVTITELNAAPTNITLSSSTLDENVPADSEVGTFSSADANTSDSHTYSFVWGPGDTDNLAFAISDNQLLINDIPDHEVQDTYNIRVQSSDGNGGTFEKEFVITINDITESPSDISLDVAAIDENNNVDDVIGILSTTDEDAGETYTYSLVSGTGDTDNSSFEVVGDELIAKESFNFESKSSYSVRIQTTDGSSTPFSKSFSISIIDVNDEPTAVLLSVNSIQENNSIADVIGSFSTEDEDTGDTHTYSLTAGVGDTDNGLFTISGNDLQANTVFDFETGSTYSIRVQSDDNNGGVIEEVFQVEINNEVEAPSDLALDNTTINESLATGTVIGTLTTTDPDVGESYTYSLVAGTGDTDNASFAINGDQLVSAVVFDFETKNSYTVRIQTSDGTNTYSESFVISINDVPPSITDIALTAYSIDENLSSGTVIGDFSTLGEDVVGTYTYSLVAGVGDDDNASFSINSGSLETNEVFDFETKSSYSVRVETNDGLGNTFEKSITISVNDVNESPTDITLDITSIDELNSIGDVVGLLSAEDVDAGESFTYSLVAGTGDTDNGSFTISGNQLQAQEIFDYETKTSYSVRVRVQDQGGLTFEKEFTVSINNVNELPTVANAIADQVYDESFGSATIDLSNVFEDVDGDVLTLTVGSNDENVVTAAIAGTTLTITEVGVGAATLTVTANDGNGGEVSDEFTVTVEAAPVNNAPTVANAIADQVYDESFGSATIDLSNVFEDADGDVLTFTVSTSDANVVTAAIEGTTLTITEVGVGSVTLTVTANDGNGGEVSDVFTVTVEAAPVNNAPTVANAVANQVYDEGFGNATIDLTNVFEDADGDVLTLSVSTGDENVVTAAIAGTTLTITEVGVGAVTLTVTANDGNGGEVSDEFIVTIEAAPVNNAPTVANAIADQVYDEGFGSATIELANVFEDADGDVLTLTVGSNDENVVTAAIAGTTLTITEVGVGAATLTVTANDGNGGEVSDEFGVTVEAAPVNNAPTVANAIADQVYDESFGSATIDLSNVFEDADGDVLTFTVSTSDANVVTAAIEGTTLTITEVGVGSVTLTVTANDGNGGEVSDVFTVTVEAAPVNNAPTVANAIADQVYDEGFGSATIDLANVFEDVDGDVLTLTVSTSDENVVTAAIAGTTLTITEVGVGAVTLTVTANDGNGGEVSDEFEVTVNEGVLSSNLQTIEYHIYPNPAVNYISVKGYETGEIQIISAEGRVIKRTNDGANMDVSSLGSGVFYLRIIQEDKVVYNSRFIKSK